MTDEQINAAITEACGWKLAGHPDQLKATDGWELGYQFVLQPDGQLVTHNSIPNYCTDLNAMHEAEKTIYKHNNLWTAYYYAVGAGPFSLHVTARKKAEAFLRTLGKWEEVQA